MKNSYFFLPGHHSNLGLINIERGIPEDSMILINKDDINDSFQADWNNLMFFGKPGINEEWTHKVFLNGSQNISEKVSVLWKDNQLELCSEHYFSTEGLIKLQIQSSTEILPWPITLDVEINLNLTGSPIEVTRKEFYSDIGFIEVKIEIMVNSTWLNHYNAIQIFDNLSTSWISLESGINTFDDSIIQNRKHRWLQKKRHNTQAGELQEEMVNFYFVRLGDLPSSETLFLVQNPPSEMIDRMQRDTLCAFTSPNWKKPFILHDKKYIWMPPGDIFQAYEGKTRLELDNENLNHLFLKTDHESKYKLDMPKNVSFSDGSYVASWFMAIDDWKEDIINLGEEE